MIELESNEPTASNQSLYRIGAHVHLPVNFSIRLLENLVRHLVLIFKLGHYWRAGLLAK